LMYLWKSNFMLGDKCACTKIKSMKSLCYDDIMLTAMVERRW
jgi:hypothetical protein